MASGMMIEGKWKTDGNQSDPSRKFNEIPTTFRDRVSKDLYQRPQFKATCNLDSTKRGYYMSMTEINPNRIVPKGPIIDFDEQHAKRSLRQRLVAIAH